MTQNEQAQFELYFDLFAHEGWRLFVRDTEEALQELDSVQGIKGPDELSFRQGKIEGLASMLNLESLMQIAYENAKEDAKYASDI